MNPPSFIALLAESSRGPLLAGLARLYEAIEAEQESFTGALAGRPGGSRGGLDCPPGCGSCCRGFSPDLLPLEAEYLAAWILSGEGRPARTEDTPRPVPLPPGTCPCFDPLRPAGSCTIYPARPLVCRLFGFTPSQDRQGGLHFSLCRHMPPPEGFPGAPGQRRLDDLTLTALGRELSRAGGSLPPEPQGTVFRAMADWSRQLAALVPDEAGERRGIREALPRAEARIALLLALSTREREQEAVEVQEDS